MFFTLIRWISKRRLSRVKLRKWFQLEDIRSEIQVSAENGKNVADLLCSYLSTAICAGNWGKLTWEEIQNDFALAVKIHSPRQDHKIFQSGKKDTQEKVTKGSWIMWANLFASNYGWDLETVSELDVDDAISLIQEILWNEQLDREWEWGLSEKSVSYDKKGKGKFHPLERPEWMNEPKKIVEQPKQKIFKEHLPPGVVVRWNMADVKH